MNYRKIKDLIDLLFFKYFRYGALTLIGDPVVLWSTG